MLGSSVDARLATAISSYAVRVQVHIPWILYPLVRLQFHDIQAFGGPFDEAAFGAFNAASERINSESRAIVDAARYGWRLLTEAELQRLDELHLQHEIALATLQRTRAPSN